MTATSEAALDSISTGKPRRTVLNRTETQSSPSMPFTMLRSRQIVGKGIEESQCTQNLRVAHRAPDTRIVDGDPD